MRALKSTAILVAALIALAGCQKAQDTKADEDAIRASTDAWDDAYNAGDTAALGAAYAEDAVLLPPNAPAVSGRAAIGEFLTADGANTRGAGLTFAIAKDSTVGVSGDLAYEAGTFAVNDASGATVATGKFIGVFNKSKDGKWLLVRDTWNMDAPPAPPAAPAEDAAAAPVEPAPG
jgi:ketosteroid isomerase-like protein